MKELFEYFLALRIPNWAWFIIIILMYLGYRSVKTRVINLVKLFLIPVLLVILNHEVFEATQTHHLLEFLMFVSGGMIVGLFAGARSGLRAIKGLNAVEVPGHLSTFVIIILFFLFKYSSHLLYNTFTDLVPYSNYIDKTMTAALPGYLLGKVIAYIYRFFKK